MVTDVTQQPNVSFIGRLYERAYAAICGAHPNYRFWHFQYLFLADTHAWQRQRTAGLSGRVLDVGCGRRPYEVWTNKAEGGVTEYIGLDVAPGPGVHIVVGPEDRWPIEDGSIDCVVCTQVLEHVEHRPHFLSELARVMRPGGTLLFTVPFLIMAHGLPYDYARFTVGGVRSLFEADYDIVELSGLGRVGASIGNLALTFIDTTMSVNRATRIIKGLLLPFWVLFCMVANAFFRLVDFVDATGSYYANVGMIARRKSR